MPIQIGNTAPAFAGKNIDGQMISLEDYRGKKSVFLVFYFADFSSVCSTQLSTYNQQLDGFQQRDSQVIAINRDSTFSHKAFCDSLGGINFPVLSDMDLSIAGDYGVNLGGGANNRAEFLIDKGGIIRWMNVEDSPGNNTPTMNDIFGAVDQL